MRRQNQNRKKIILGLTGSFGSGKTTVARMFSALGSKVIDADSIAHKLLEPAGIIYRRIINIFGKGILKKNRAIDRKKLAALVFNNKTLLRKLNRITHPEIIRTMQRQIKEARAKFVVLDAPLLIEAGLRNTVDKLIVVKIKREEQIKRLLSKTRLTKQEILKRIKSQIPLRVKVYLADFIIDNSGTVKNTHKQVKQIRRQLWKN